MRRILAICLALLPLPTLAQQPPPDPAQAALGQEIMECIGGKVQLRGRVNQLEAELAKLKSEAKAPDAAPQK